MKILLTGAYGNVGSYVVKELLRQGYDTRTFDLRTPRNEEAAAEYVRRIEAVWGDLRDIKSVRRAVKGADYVLHLGAIIPPLSDADPDMARAVNIGGTRNLLTACEAQPKPPRLFFVSSFDVFGHTQALPPPRRATDPVEATDVYTKTKIEGEKMVRKSSLPWLIARFSDMPIIALRDPVPAMFEIGLDNRFETMHPADGALSLVNALKVEELWGNRRLLLIGGGPKCQLTYREFLFTLLTAMGIGPLPEEIFSKKEYVTDWLDTEESQRLLRYQRHSFQDIAAEVSGLLGSTGHIDPSAREYIRQGVIEMSPYYKKPPQKSLRHG
ncbi:MAG: NAD(P)-dependent oxidoreductase [Promethearchaeati archaeon SRVP18_Atabeyarchaeia-1]